MPFSPAGEWVPAPASSAPPAVALAGPVTIPQTGDPALAPLVTLHDVELCRVGQWNASTGAATVDDAMLAAVVAAAADPQVDLAPAHFGHFDPRFPALMDGEPAVGWVENLRVRSGTLVGDLTHVPAKLADVIRSAYRRRSVEFAENVRTPGGRVHRWALTGLGLLGVQAPAVKGLADVVARYSSGTTASASQLFSLQLEDAPAAQPVLPLPSPAPAGHDVAQHTPYTGGALVPSSQFTDERLRGLLGLAQDADVSVLQAQLAAQAPAPQQQPQQQAPQVQQPLTPQPQQLQQLPGQPATPAPVAQAPAAVLPLTVHGQPFAPQAPQQVQAPQQQLQPTPLGQLVQQPAPQQQAPAAPQQQAQVYQFPVQQAQAPAPAAAPAAPAQAPAIAAGAAPVYFPTATAPMPGTVTLSAEQWGRMEHFLAAQDAQQVNDIADQAVSTGRIALAEKPAWLQALQRDREGALTLLRSLAPGGRIPTGEIGGAGVTALAAGQTVQQRQDAAFSTFEAQMGLEVFTPPAAAAAGQQIGA